MAALAAALTKYKKKGKLAGGKKNFIQGAIKRPGALTAKAKSAGEDTMDYAEDEKHAPGRTGKQARFALLLQGFRKKK